MCGRLKGLLPPDLLWKLCKVQEALGSSQGALDYCRRLLPNSPAKQGIEVPFLRVKGLVFHASKSKADGQHGEGEDEEAGDPKHSSPGIKPAHGGEKGTSDFRVSEGTFAHLRSDPKWEEGSSVVE